MNVCTNFEEYGMCYNKWLLLDNKFFTLFHDRKTDMPLICFVIWNFNEMQQTNEVFKKGPIM